MLHVGNTTGAKMQRGKCKKLNKVDIGSVSWRILSREPSKQRDYWPFKPVVRGKERFDWFTSTAPISCRDPELQSRHILGLMVAGFVTSVAGFRPTTAALAAVANKRAEICCMTTVTLLA